MMLHRAEIDETNSYAISEFRYHRFGAGKNARIHREDIEIGHLIWIRPHRARVDPPFAQEKCKVAIRLHFRIARMNNKKSHQPERHLRHLVVM